MLQQSLETWAAHFAEPPTVVSKAPGRVNLVGEHTDYNEGYVLPMAIDLAVSVLSRIASEDRFVSVQVPDAVDHRGPGWRRYADACRSALETQGLQAPPLEVVVNSSLPGGSGLSSSAALELAFLSAWNEAAQFCLSNFELAHLAWIAENQFVGVKVGRMDQMASALGVEGHALFMDMRSLDVEAIKMPSGVDVVILDTRKPRALAAGKYNERVAECARATAAVGKFKQVKALRDATLDDLKQARSEGLDETAYRRARHVVTENGRVVHYKSALTAGDKATLGEICEASHASLRDDYEVTVPELDAMVRSARSAPACIGARMTGAGFGGCCVALIEQGSFAEFRNSTIASYSMYGFVTPNLFKVSASSGAAANSYEGTKPG
jgi:galactokinase